MFSTNTYPVKSAMVTDKEYWHCKTQNARFVCMLFQFTSAERINFFAKSAMVKSENIVNVKYRMHSSSVCFSNFKVQNCKTINLSAISVKIKICAKSDHLSPPLKLSKWHLS